MEDQRGAFVRGGAPREANRESLLPEAGAGDFVHPIQQQLLGGPMRTCDLMDRDADRVAEREGVVPPLRREAVEESPKGGRSPRRWVDPVRDRVDGVMREHVPRNLAVTHGDPVHEMGSTQRELGQVDLVPLPEPREPADVPLPEDDARHLRRELVVTGRDGGMRGEDASTAKILEGRQDFLLAGVGPAHPLVEQGQDRQGRVPLVQVETVDRSVAKSPQHPHTADPAGSPPGTGDNGCLRRRGCR